MILHAIISPHDYKHPPHRKYPFSLLILKIGTGIYSIQVYSTTHNYIIWSKNVLCPLPRQHIDICMLQRCTLLELQSVSKRTLHNYVNPHVSLILNIKKTSNGVGVT